MVLYIYAGTLFLSAFALFLVQPIIGKMILPKLGGTPQVWNTCMVFFQMVLLAGYAYTHTVSTRLNPRRQIALHGVLLFLPLLVLFVFTPGNPFNVEWWNAPPGSNPIPKTLLLLVTVVGLPFFVVSTTAPLLQRWFVYTGHPASKDPYFLYGASNIGSLLGLLLYPLLIEAIMTRRAQAWLWSGFYVAFLVFVLYAAWIVWKPAGRFMPVIGPVPEPEPLPQLAPPEGSTAIAALAPGSGTTPASAAPSTTPAAMAFKKGPAPRGGPKDPLAVDPNKDVEGISPWRRFRWIALAAVPSSLMLGVTTHITTDLSPIPLFWIVPLALYLLSFICVFAKWPVVWVDKVHPFVLYAQPVSLALMLFIDWRSGAVFTVAFFQGLAFFLTALAMHGELARDRPSVKHLTEFYLMMSVGGMIGGMFNGLIAPVIPIPYVWEFSLAVVAACLFRPMMKESGWTDDLVAGMMEQQPAAPAPIQAKGGKGKAHPKPASISMERPAASANLALTMDFVLPLALCALLLLLSLMFGKSVFSNKVGEGEKNDRTREFYAFMLLGLPLIIACFYYARPLRLALAVGAVIVFHGFMVGDSYMYGDRSYFGIIRVRALPGEGVGRPGTMYHSLMHGNIDHGMNFRKPGMEGPFTMQEYVDATKDDWGWRIGQKESKDFSRIASTYYHRYGPVGVVMERWNWASNQDKPLSEQLSSEMNYWTWRQNTWHADARMPASLIGLALADGQLGALLPGRAAFSHAFSEPPIATIGLGTGTMGGYARPYMSCHFYEIDNHIRKLSLPDYKDPKGVYPTFLSWWHNEAAEIIASDDPAEKAKLPKGKIYFSYLFDAVNRGADVQVYMGDAFQRMGGVEGKGHPYYNINDPEARQELPPGGPNGYYKMMVVDAFSSDAIPVHLITKEAMEMYFQKLAPDGILCVHTSNRYVELPKVVVATAAAVEIEGTDGVKRPLVARRGHDASPFNDERTEHYTSEWVMVAREAKYLQPFLKSPSIYKGNSNDKETYGEAITKHNKRQAEKGFGASSTSYWDDPTPYDRYVWTLDHSNLFNVVRSSKRDED